MWMNKYCTKTTSASHIHNIQDTLKNSLCGVLVHLCNLYELNKSFSLIDLDLNVIMNL